jgi:hypothetical protein
MVAQSDKRPVKLAGWTNTQRKAVLNHRTRGAFREGMDRVRRGDDPEYRGNAIGKRFKQYERRSARVSKPAYYNNILPARNLNAN